MARDHSIMLTDKSRKRSGEALTNGDTPTKRNAPISLRLDVSSSPSAVQTPFSRPSNGLTSSSPLNTSPILPMFKDMPVRSSVPAEDREDSKDFGRGNSVDPGLAVLGEPVTKLVDLITSLRDNGIARLDIDLPQIVVVGDQSTGKSSLIEGLSAIKVPRKEGTCTRCPLEINLKATEKSWHCRISIIKQYGYKVPSSEADRKLGLGPWNVKYTSAEVEFFMDVTDKKDIPTYLARAQLAVLNPGKPITCFAVSADQVLDSELTQEAFSPNVIRLDIQAPRLPSLSFFDLPGVIVQDVEPYVPKMIRNLVKTYISSSRSLVLLTVPMDNDRANSSSAGLVHDAGAENRTIGIISKPDRLVATNIEQWREILAGEKFKLNLGYRVVMNPADASIEHAEARRQERVFFNTNPNFRGPLGGFQDRFGTEKLQAYLSTQLLKTIRGCLPEIDRKVQDRVFEIEKELQTLPKAPDGNVVFEVQQRLVNLERRVTAAINNSTELVNGDDALVYEAATHWFQNWHQYAQAFFQKLIKTAPQLDLSQFASTAGRTNGEAIFVDDDSDEDQARRETPVRKRPSQVPSNGTSTQPSSFSARQQKDIDAFIEKSVKKFDLAQLRKNLHAFNGGVYGIGDPRVFERLFHDSILHWPGLLKQFLQYTAKTCKKLVIDLIDLVFSDLKETELLRRIKHSAMQFASLAEREQFLMSRRLSNVEKGKPLTLDGEGQEASKRVVLGQLSEQLQQAMIQGRTDEMHAANMKVSGAEHKKITEQAKLDVNQHDHELHELAGTIAYYRVAARRFADYNSLTIRNEFFLSLKERMWRQVATDLGLGPDADLHTANEELKSLMVPSPKDYQRRKELEHELMILENTKKDVLRVLDSDAVNGAEDNYGDDMDF